MTASVAPRRLCLVLLVLTGLLGMHGLASDHASMAMPGTLTAPAAMAVEIVHGKADAVADRMLMPEYSDGAIQPPAIGTAELAAAPVAGTAPGGGHSAIPMVGLCLAVLAGAALLAALARRSVAAPERRRPRTRPQLLAALRALTPPGPPDLVAGLCVSRT